MSMELDWTIATEDIPKGGLARTFVADTSERESVARALDIIACEELEAALHFRPLADRSYSVSGRIRARVVQACVVTLDPVPGNVTATVAIEFRSADDMPEMPEGEFDPHSADEPEPIVDGIMDVGGVVYQLLATSLDPYPRKPGAAFDWRDLKDAAPDAGGVNSANPSNPFAALAKLKPKS